MEQIYRQSVSLKLLESVGIILNMCRPNGFISYEKQRVQIDACLNYEENGLLALLSYFT